MKENIAKFNKSRSRRKVKGKESIPLVTFYLDVSISSDLTELSYIPYYEFFKDVSEDMVDQIGDMLKAHFSESIDQLLTLYKNS